jgi:hypothetical protein
MIKMDYAALVILHFSTKIINALSLDVRPYLKTDVQNAHIPLGLTLNLFVKSLTVMLTKTENVLDVFKDSPYPQIIFALFKTQIVSAITISKLLVKNAKKAIDSMRKGAANMLMSIAGNLMKVVSA